MLAPSPHAVQMRAVALCLTSSVVRAGKYGLVLHEAQHSGFTIKRQSPLSSAWLASRICPAVSVSTCAHRPPLDCGLLSCTLVWHLM